MKTFKRVMALFLVLSLFITSQTATFSLVAAAMTDEGVTRIENDFIKVTVDNATGRFGIRTIEGQPVRKNDEHVDMLFRGDDPETSFTTFRIDGTDYIFGNPYKFASGLFSEISKPVIVENTDGTTQIETTWFIKGVTIKQVIMLYMDANDVTNAGNVNVRYEVYNYSDTKVEIGSRILLDTMVSGNDGPEFQIGTSYRVPLSVERKFVHDPAAELGTPTEDIALYKLPAYWVMRDHLDLTNPLATNVIAYGFNNIAENKVNIVDEMIVGHWNGLSNTKWDYEVNSNLNFTKDTNNYGTADSAVALYWQPEELPAGEFTSFETVYGLGEIVEPDKVFSIRYLDPIQQLATLPDQSDYVDNGVFEIIAEVENLPAFNMEHSSIKLNMTLESGLSFAKLDEAGQVMRDELTGKPLTEPTRSKETIYRKPATPEETDAGIVPKYKPGDTVTISYKVVATGRTWPTTKQYLLTASSPETISKLTSSAQDDVGILAQYESSAANYILLPAIGEAVQTYAYALSPKELYYDDTKYVTVNLSNIEAYTAGDKNADPNFNLYFKRLGTNERYRVPVQESVVMQETNEGSVGDMRITYRGGDLVDEQGLVIESGLGPELPLGEYQVEIDYLGNSGDEELSELFDMTTTQTFMVSDNSVTRIREADRIVIYRQDLDLSGVVPNNASEAYLEDMELDIVFDYDPYEPGGELAADKQKFQLSKTAISLTSGLLDSLLDLRDFNSVNTLEALPVYNYAIFDSEEEEEEFFEDRDDRELLVEIEGMVKQVGSGSDTVTIVDTSTEPAIINGAVAYEGKDLAFVHGKLEIYGTTHETKFLNTLFIKGDGQLYIAGSGFVFHEGEWSLDFFNGFTKSHEDEDDEEEEEEEDEDNPEDDTLNGSLRWAVGNIVNRLNPLRQVMIGDVYFNQQSLFRNLPLSISGLTFEFYETRLRPEGVSFGGNISFLVVEGEIKHVIFNDKGFVGVDASLGFELGGDLGLFKGDDDEDDDKGKKKKEEDDDDGGNSVSGEISVTHYKQKIEGVNNYYALKFDADLENMVGVGVELAFKQVDDGRVLPDVIGFRASLPPPGVMIMTATFLTEIRGAIRELADTIAGGTDDDPFPLTLEAGVGLRVGVSPANFLGDIDLTLKRTGIKIEGSMGFSIMPNPSGSQIVPMLTYAMVEAQWVQPWFVRMQAEVDVSGWGVIIGQAGIFIGQNLELNRIDFEGFVGAKVQVPTFVPIIGGMPLASVFLGANNDKIWGSVGILMLTFGITYYWGGGVEFGTSDANLEDGFMHMLINDPEHGPYLMSFGQGTETVATSWISEDGANMGITYHSLDNDVQIIENGNSNVGIGGIEVSNGGHTHDIPMDRVTDQGLIEIMYDGPEVPTMTLTKPNGEMYDIVWDNTNSNPLANAFTQYIPAAQSVDEVDTYKAYVIIPKTELQSGKWTLDSLEKVQTKLLDVPAAPSLSNVQIEKNATNENVFNAKWSAANAKEGDLVSLYLTSQAVNENPVTDASGESVLEVGDPGLLIAKDVPVSMNGQLLNGIATGSLPIDVTQVSLLGGTEDIRGLLKQGHYYLRAELKSSVGYSTKTSIERFELIDPMAPGEVKNVTITPAGNGKFGLSFTPAQKKAAHSGYEYYYNISAYTRLSNGGLAAYDNLGELLYSEAELENYWNEASGRYENIPVGGWKDVSIPSDEEGTEKIKYIGLETDRDYVLGVAAVTKPTEEADRHQNYHFADVITSAATYLPAAVHPKLKAAGDSSFGAKIEHMTNAAVPSIELVADQENIVVDAIFDGEVIASTTLTNAGGKSKGTISFDKFTVDGTYGIELRATNTVTKDRKNTYLYLTVDTIAPMLYISSPLTGARTADGHIQVVGQTSNDAILTINGIEVVIDPDGNGEFTANIPVQSDQPTAMLSIKARDIVGNSNEASIQITNDAYKVPVALVLREMKLENGEEKKIEALLRYPDGKTEDNKPAYKLVPIPDEDYGDKLSFSRTAGDAVSVSDDGVVSSQQVGASLLRAEYSVSEGVTLKSDLPVNVTIKEYDTLGDLQAYTTAITSTQSKVTVTNADDLVGYQLVYHVVKSGQTSETPSFHDDLTAWTILPANGLISGLTSSDRIIVAKRESGSKAAVATSGLIVPELKPANAGGGVMIIPATPGGLELSANGMPIATEWVDHVLVATLVAEDVKAAQSQEIVISSSNDAAKQLSIVITNEAREQAVQSNKKLVIDLPNMKLSLTTKQLKEVNGDLVINIEPNSSTQREVGNNAFSTLNAKLLGDGQGVTFSTPTIDAKHTSKVSIAVPSNIRIQEVTGVILMTPDGRWTPVPWSIAEDHKDGLFVDLQLSGQGSIMFVQNSAHFTDVADSFWGKAAIEQAAGRMIINGRSAQKFEPNSQVTRAEFPTMLLRSAGLMTQQATASFGDVKSTAWYYESVGIAASLGITTGLSNGSYAPNDTINRIQAMVMVGRVIELMDADAASITEEEVNQLLQPFGDAAQIPAWARKATALAVKHGIVQGMNGSINPDGQLTRAQAATISVRLENWLSK